MCVRIRSERRINRWRRIASRQARSMEFGMCTTRACQRGDEAPDALVPVEGIEPPLLAEHDFESCASTNSATRALSALYIFSRGARQKENPPGRCRACFRLKD